MGKAMGSKGRFKQFLMEELSQNNGVAVGQGPGSS